MESRKLGKTRYSTRSEEGACPLLLALWSLRQYATGTWTLGPGFGCPLCGLRRIRKKGRLSGSILTSGFEKNLHEASALSRRFTLHEITLHIRDTWTAIGSQRRASGIF